VWVKVGPIAKRLATRLRQDTIPAGVRALLDAPDDPSPPTPEEAEVLRLIRSGDYHTIEIVMRGGGEIKTLYTERRASELEPEAVLDILRQHDYQTLNVIKRGGETVVIDQRAARKLRA
jgi:hypothetical protein